MQSENVILFDNDYLYFSWNSITNALNPDTTKKLQL